MNYVTTSTTTGLMGGANPNEKNYRFPKVVSPSNRILFADSLYAQLNHTNSDYVTWLTYMETTFPAIWYRTAYRHNNGANLAFFDGHVERLSGKEISKNDKLWIVYK
jgi:prepilin-type processing-associated H-X9-DG protein